MYTVSKTFSFCYGHRLLNDSGKCAHIHGHTAKATFVLENNKLDEHGMVIHFDRLKNTMGKWIGDNLDHTLILSEGDPVIKQLEMAGEKFRGVPFNPTAENVARMLFDVAVSHGLPIMRVEVWESETSKAEYIKP